jgi:hypothetical protein
VNRGDGPDVLSFTVTQKQMCSWNPIIIARKKKGSCGMGNDNSKAAKGNGEDEKGKPSAKVPHALIVLCPMLMSF